MKKIIFLALVALLGIHTVDAQRRGGTRTPEQIVEKLDKKLNLTDEQEKQITELYTEFFKKELSREERRSEMEKLNEKYITMLDLFYSPCVLMINEDIYNNFTDEQKEAFEQMKK